MTKTNAKTARSAKAAKPVVDKHELTPAAKARKAKSAEKMAKTPKASNQTGSVTLSAADKAQIAAEATNRKRPKVLGVRDLGGKPANEERAELNRELEQISKETGAVRAFDMITISGEHPQSNGFHMVGANANNAITVPSHKFVGELAEAGKLGMSFRNFKALWEDIKRKSTGKLAQGLDGRNAPHSAKAVGDHNAAAKGSNKADKVQARKAAETAKKAERKADRAAKAAPKADDNRKITIVDKKFSYGKEGSARNASWLACKGSKTVAEYAAKGGALKYLPRWVSAGAIKLG